MLVLLPICMLRLTATAARHRTGTGRTSSGSASCGSLPPSRAASSTRRRRRLNQYRHPGLRRGQPAALRPQGPQGLRPPARRRQVRLDSRRPAADRHCAARTCCWSSSRATGGSRSRTPPTPRASSRPRLRDRPADRSGFHVPQRLPPVTDVRCRQLAGPLHPGVRTLGQQPAALRPALDHGRLTLASAFHQADWRTVFDDPANTKDWPEGRDFYHFDHIYDSRNVGIAGPPSATPTSPTSIRSRHFREHELVPTRPAAGDGRDRPRVEPPPVGAAADDGAVGPAR